jgi:2'-hydroxyisoflavone reductase
MRILVIGGTVFVGRAIVDAAVEAGHDVTVFHRGSAPLHRDDVEEQLGDRERTEDVHRLADAGRDASRWDVVVDTCGYVPRVVGMTAAALAPVVERYVFISTVSVYADLEAEGIDESAPLATPPAPDVEEITGETYGPLKVACEQVVERTLPGRTLLVRPGLLVGPHDPTGRFTHWARRIDEGGPVLVPRTEQLLQVLDARDLGRWVVRAAADDHIGSVNLVGPPGALTWHGALEELVELADGDAELVPVDPSALVERDVQPWRDVPLWLGPDADDGMMRVQDRLARSLGLETRSFAETAADTLAWLRASGPVEPAGGGAVPGLDRDRERELLDELAG